MSQKVKSFLLRFVKGFVGGGLATAIVILQTTPPVTTWSEFPKMSIALLIGFLTGGLLATEKMFNWQE